MKQNTLNQMKDFEIFVEKMENLVEEVKKNHLIDKDGYQYRIEDFDLRDIECDTYKLPFNNKLSDYFEMWEKVQDKFDEYIADNDAANEMFFDLYWNNVKENAAYFDGLALWIFFDNEYGIFYMDDTEIQNKITKRNEAIIKQKSKELEEYADELGNSIY